MTPKFVFTILAALWLHRPTSSHYCPLAADILPCVCSRRETTQELKLNCSGVLDGAQLAQIFHANFPNKTFGEFVMAGSDEWTVPIVYLPNGIFQDLTFKTIDISRTDIQHVGEQVFAYSYDTLERLTVTRSKLRTFPATYIQFFSRLTTLDLSRNDLVFLQNLHSPTLTYIYLQHNPSLVFTDQVFTLAPNLLEIDLNNCGLHSIPLELFKHQTNLLSVNLEGNELEYLNTSTLAFSSNKVIEVILTGNKIASVESGFISGTSAEAYIVMMNNLLKEVNEEAWRPVLQKLEDNERKGVVSLDDNPLVCGCGLEWLVTSPGLLGRVAEGAACDDGTPIHDLDPDIFFTHCH